jgi:hypothetical protein
MKKDSYALIGKELARSGVAYGWDMLLPPVWFLCIMDNLFIVGPLIRRAEKIHKEDKTCPHCNGTGKKEPRP